MLLEHLDGNLNYCRTKVPLGVVEAVNGNIKSLLRRGRGYQNLCYLLLKPQRIAATNTEFVVFRKAAQKSATVEFFTRSFKHRDKAPQDAIDDAKYDTTAEGKTFVNALRGDL
jgi:hypothetical protein